MRKIFFRIGIALVFIALLLYGTYKLMNMRSFQVFGEITESVETEEKMIALTFDDGPTKNTENILPLLEKYHAKATFFLIGEEIEKNPDEAKKIANAGHQIGNHSYSHRRMVFKSSKFIKQEVEKTDELIRQSGYKGEIDFRPPFGKKLIALPYYLYKHNRETITWSIEPDTYYQQQDDKIKYVEEQVKPGAIILMHPMYDSTDKELKVIEEVLQSLTEQGYQFVTVNELQTQLK